MVKSAFSDKKFLEDRLEAVERYLAWAKPIIDELAKQYDLQKPRVNPVKYCKDELDKKIINYLIDNFGAGATEIAIGVGLEHPETARHLIGKRLKRLRKQSLDDGWCILDFDPATREHPVTKTPKYRAWWIHMEDVDVATFKENVKL